MTALAHLRATATSEPPLASPPGPDAQLRALDESPAWPVTRLVGWTLTLAVGVGALGPLAATSGDWIGLAVPAIATTLCARALFEAVAFAIPSSGRIPHVLPALPAALLSGLLMTGSSAILGDGIDPAAGSVSALLVALALLSAGSARDLEIRVRLGLRRVFFVGSTDTRHELERELERRHDARLVGATAGAVIAPDRLVQRVLDARATVLVLDGAALQVPTVIEAAKQLNLDGVRVRELVSYYESEFKKVPLTEVTPAWFLFDISPIHRRRGYRVARRGAETLAAAVFLFCALPVLAAAVLAIKLTSPGPALYRQRRVGRGGSHFTLVKLRTMLGDPPSPAWAASEELRVTAVGRFLRRFRIDELPQLANVIRGDLALIGPRPEQVPIVQRLERELPHYAARHCIRPGLTGWAQVHLGYAGSLEGTVAKLQRDLYYVKHSSVRLDGLILWLTFKTLIAGRG
jgi:lipopolysaccharide/colanic/teichoic acid biosynthesis glycosyltransferase